MSSIYNWLFGSTEASSEPFQKRSLPEAAGVVDIRFLVLPTRNCHLQPEAVAATLQESLDRYAAITGDAAALMAVTGIEPKLARIHALLTEGGLTHGRDVLVSYLASSMALLLGQPVLVVPISIVTLPADQRAATATKLGDVILTPQPNAKGVHAPTDQLPQ